MTRGGNRLCLLYILYLVMIIRSYDMNNFHFQPFPSLNTPRLHMRQLLHKDARDILALRSDDAVNKYIDRPATTTIEEAKAFIERINAGIANNESLYWVICLKDENDLIGTICLWNFSADKKTAETGYELLPAFHNKGYMHEALHAVLQFARETLGLESIEAFTHADNQSSRLLLEKNGFIKDPERQDKENENNIVMLRKF